MPERLRKPKYTFFFLSLAVVVIASVLLFLFIGFYKSHEVYKVKEFSSRADFSHGILVCENEAYLYSEYGGNFENSDLFSRPLSQYNGPDTEFSYYLFGSKFIGASIPDSLFSGANTSTKFITKNNDTLFLVDTENLTCSTILKDLNIISCSASGTYFLEENNSKYYFHKKTSDSFDFASPIELLLNSENIESVEWVNDRYVLIKAFTNTHLIYFVADAENGEASPLYSIELNEEEYKKELLSDRYFVKSIDGEKMVLFGIWSQEECEIKLEDAKQYQILAISHDASYAAIKKDGELFLCSKNGKLKDIENLIDSDYAEIVFLLDNIVLLNPESTADAAVVYKLMF